MIQIPLEVSEAWVFQWALWRTLPSPILAAESSARSLWQGIITGGDRPAEEIEFSAVMN